MSLTEDQKRKLKLATRCVHAGKGIDKETRAVRRPITMANSFKFPDEIETHPDYFDVAKHPRYFHYPRTSHPNARYLEERLAAMEGGEDCFVTATGVSAIAGTFFNLLSSGDHIIVTRVCYIGIHQFLTDHLCQRYGVELSLVDSWDADEVKKALKPNTKIIHIETPANPTTYVSDIEAIAKISKEAGTIMSVDSTWSGLVCQNPLALGVDLVMHSLTKYVNGHGDSLGGAVIGSKEMIDQLREGAGIHLGATISPFTAWLLMRGSVTLPMRMKQHNENAMKIAAFLESHPKVSFVRYPGLKSHPQHELAKKQMTGFGGMMNFGIKTDMDGYFDFLRNMNIITHATCLGHDESLIQLYAQVEEQDPMSRTNYPEEIGGTFCRFSVGLEDVDDLIADLEGALAAVK